MFFVGYALRHGGHFMMHRAKRKKHKSKRHHRKSSGKHHRKPPPYHSRAPPHSFVQIQQNLHERVIHIKNFLNVKLSLTFLRYHLSQESNIVFFPFCFSVAIIIETYTKRDRCNLDIGPACAFLAFQLVRNNQ